MLGIKETKKYIQKNGLTDMQVEEFSNAEYSLNSKAFNLPVTIKEYREILSDYESTDEQVKKRLQYLEALCQNIIRLELQKVRVISV